jgi:hypothetical protein
MSKKASAIARLGAIMKILHGLGIIMRIFEDWQFLTG